jgi:O-antigen/teichoic acid export membrane protein
MNNNIEISKELVSSSKWNSLGMILKYITVAITIIITARVISPYQFGIVATSSVVISLFVTLSQFGFAQAIVGLQEVDEEYFNTLSTVSLILSSFFYFIIFILSETISNYFNEPIIEDIIIISAIAVFFILALAIPRAIIERKLNYKYLLIIDVSNNLTILIAVIVMAFLNYGIWILVVPILIGQICSMFMAFYLSGYVPKLGINFQKLKLTMNFAMSALISNISNYLSKNLIIFFGAKVFGFSQLGFFTFSSGKVEKPVEIISGVMMPQFFAIMSRASSDIKSVKASTLSMIKNTSAVVPITYIILLFSSPIFFPILFTDKWNEAILVFQLLCIIQIIRGFTLPSNAVLYALKLPHISAKITLIRLLLYVLITILFNLYSITMILLIIMIVIADSIVCLFYLNKLLRAIRCSLFEYFNYIKKNLFVLSSPLLFLPVINLFSNKFNFSILFNDIAITIAFSLFVFFMYYKELLIFLKELTKILYSFKINKL